MNPVIFLLPLVVIALGWLFLRDLIIKTTYDVRCQQTLEVPAGGTATFFAFLIVSITKRNPYTVSGKITVKIVGTPNITISPTGTTDTDDGNGPSFTEPHIEYTVTGTHPGETTIEVSGLSKDEKKEHLHKPCIVKVKVV